MRVSNGLSPFSACRWRAPRAGQGVSLHVALVGSGGVHGPPCRGL